jgi:hypothetical protein
MFPLLIWQKWFKMWEMSTKNPLRRSRGAKVLTSRKIPSLSRDRRMCAVFEIFYCILPKIRSEKDLIIWSILMDPTPNPATRKTWLHTKITYEKKSRTAHKIQERQHSIRSIVTQKSRSNFVHTKSHPKRVN